MSVSSSTNRGKACISPSRGPIAAAALAGIVLTLLVTISLMAPVLTSAVPAMSASMIQDETPPVADAGDNSTAYVNMTVMFDGSSSTDDVGIVNYTWTLDDGGTKTLYGATPSYVFLSAGAYVVNLTVFDAHGNSDSDEVTVFAIIDDVPPVASAGLSYEIPLGTRVTLNGTSSSDNAGIVLYEWIMTKDGEVLEELVGPVHLYYFNETGNYTITLTVTDVGGLTNETTIYMEVYAPPTWLDENWFRILVSVLVVGAAIWFVVHKYRRDHALLTKTDIDKMQLRLKSGRKTWKIFRQNRLGFTGLVVLLVFVFMAVFAPFISVVSDPTSTAYMEPNIRPVWVNPLPPTFDESPYTGLIHPFGTDNSGRDVYSLTVFGTRASLMVGLAATLISVILGTSIGLAAGYFGRFTSEVLMRVTDFFLVLPWFPLMIVMMAILGQEFIWVIVVIGITGWPSTARIVRSQVITIKERQFIERARAVGAGDGHIIGVHILPNVMPLIFANTVLLIALAIFSEAFLTFFGLGDPDVISWGAMLEAAYNYSAFSRGAWWWILMPGMSIIIMVLSFSLVGYALDDVLNPKLRKR